MVSGINAGLEQGLFGLEPDDNRWPGALIGERPRGDPSPRDPGAIYRFTFPGETPAIARVRDAGHGELSFHIALWPTDDADTWIPCMNGGRLAGEVWATGWVERRTKPYLQTGRSYDFTGARLRLAIVSAAVVYPLGSAYADRGRFRL